jgi:hypothetical protein
MAKNKKEKVWWSGLTAEDMKGISNKKFQKKSRKKTSDSWSDEYSDVNRSLKKYRRSKK